MALKAELTAAEHATLAEPLKNEYALKGDKYILSLEGDLPEVRDVKTKLAEFRDNNRTMHGELEQLRPLATKFKDVDVDEYKTLKASADALKTQGINNPADIDARIKAATDPLVKKFEAEEKRRQDAEQKILDGDFDKLVTDVVLKAGVRAQAVRHTLPMAREKFELKDGALMPKAGVKHPTEPHKEFTPSEWVIELAKSDAFLFEPTEGADAPGSRSKKPGAKVLINPSPEEMGRHMDDIASGKVTVVRQ